ncbi:hypothetical protein [Pedomonas mirosovicensis]|uniref:hypothetical protein n=1 Tax=Pedomonas mirosovicensis TaxID=2908641 RepID=UPI00216863ED|nr:hypothetical protein [Pedomonas mirosovicensis]MCH8685119.1 hypothetical protein [Pedomonas mirosovicensis]
MRTISAGILDASEHLFADRAILCLELTPADHLLLWSFRELLTARLEGRSVRQILGGLKGAPDRSATILLRLLAAELIAVTRRNLRFGQPHCQHLMPDELALLASIDRIQAGDEARAGMLLQNLCANSRIDGLMEAAHHLGRALGDRGMIIRVMRLVPPEMLPSIH